MREYFMTTPRIGFSHWEEQDEALAESLWGQEAVTRFVCASGKFSKQDVINRLNLEIENNKKYGIQYFPIFERETGELVGCCGLRPYGDNPKVCEIGCHLRENFWHKGIATEAVQAMIDYTFHEFGVEELHVGHHPENQASAKLVKKLGFEYVEDCYYDLSV